jgi:6-phosphogluconolactonase
MLVYRFDSAKGTLAPHDPPYASVAPGSGPRHFAFHPSGRSAYVINELNSTLTAFSYDAQAGILREIQTIATVPEGYTAENYTSEVLAHPSGKFVYGSNRGHDSIAIYTVDAGTGKLAAAGYQPSGGKWPRNFNIDASGSWMIVGNQDSHNVLFFRIDRDRGTLTQVGPAIEAPVPICFKMVPISG